MSDQLNSSYKQMSDNIQEGVIALRSGVYICGIYDLIWSLI